MKQILLKPEIFLKENETYLINNEECVYLGYGENKGQLEFRGFSSRRFWIWASEIKEIIESPDEPLPNDGVCLNKDYVEGFTAAVKHVSQYMSELINEHGRDARLQTLFAMVDTHLETMIEKKSSNQVSESAKMVEEEIKNMNKTCKCGSEVEILFSNDKCFRTKCLKCGIGMLRMHLSAQENPPVAKKEAVEYCECDKSNSAIWLCSYNNKINKYFCRTCTKEFRLPAQPKPAGNPFKVGEIVRAFFVQTDDLGTHLAVERKGKILKLADHGECIQIDLENWRPVWVHYKQCERVE